jgi:hypothetical protein
MARTWDLEKRGNPADWTEPTENDNPKGVISAIIKYVPEGAVRDTVVAAALKQWAKDRAEAALAYLAWKDAKDKDVPSNAGALTRGKAVKKKGLPTLLKLKSKLSNIKVF